MTFESKFDIGKLIEYKQDKNDESNRFGHVLEVTFYKPTAGKPAVQYTIQRVNSGDIDRGIYEHDIIKGYDVG